MSGTPKRLHEEGSHSNPMKRPLEESGIYSTPGKLVHTAGNDFRLPFESGQDGRLAKIQRVEPRDPDKRPLLPHRMTSSPGNYLDHPVTAENRSDLRSTKDSKDVKAETRETIRELYADTRIDRQVSRVEKDSRLDIRGDEREIRSDRGFHGDFKGEKDGYIAANSHFSWKEAKEHHRGKRYADSSADGLESWRIPRHAQQNTNEISRNLPIAEERESLGAHETVGENRVDMKVEDKLREKDRKRKDDKHRDFGEKDKERNDYRNSPQAGVTLNEYKGPLKEERGTEQWERERSHAQKAKEYNDNDKDSNKGESSNANDKEIVGGPVKIPDKEIITSQHHHKDLTCSTPDRDMKDKGRGPGTDAGDKHEKHGNCYDKESDDGCADGDTERNGETFGNGVQHRRRVLRSRGTAQGLHRRSRAQDEGSQGQSEAATVVYKPGVCMEELLKSWREFEASQDSSNDERSQSGPTLEIRIPAEYVSATNHQVRGAQLWGTDIYTNDSDLVAVLMHTGYCRPTASPLPAINELLATVRVLPSQDCYASTLRNNVRSRAWGAGIGCSFHVERCSILKKGGGTIELQPHLNHVSAVEPTLAPVSVERTMTTRAAASNALRQQRLVREVTVQYNLCNEPWQKYSLSIVADKGLKKPLHTAARLKKGEVLYLETHRRRYELCFSGERTICNGSLPTSAQSHELDQKLQNQCSIATNGERPATNRETTIDVFRWSRCKKPLPQKVMCSIGIPLPTEHVELLEENLEWEDVQWSQTGVWVAGKEYGLVRVHFLSHT